MANDNPPRPSFSRRRRWSIGFNVVLAVFVVFAVVVMVNYLGGRYFSRLSLSSHSPVKLSSRTLSLLRSLTNQMHITVYYDRTDDQYGTIVDLVKEYCAANRKISAEYVDYEGQPGLAEKIKLKYNLTSAGDKDIIIFDCEGKRPQIVYGTELTVNEQTQLPTGPDGLLRFQRKQVAFKGELAFTTRLLALTSPNPFKACFLQGHREQRPDDGGDQGYLTLATTLEHNFIRVEPLLLAGTNTVPADCSLLIVAGPEDPIPQPELDRIEQYLNEGGRLLVLFSAYSVGREIGLEKILAKWGIKSATGIVKDPKLTTSGQDVVVFHFTRHPAVNPLTGSQLDLVLPREIGRLEVMPASADGVKVEEIAFAGDESFVQRVDGVPQPRAVPLIAAAEKTGVTEHGSTRILVAGDSLFLRNAYIDVRGNSRFISLAANWLLARENLLEGVEPQPIGHYRMVMTTKQMQAAHWFLLGAMPGGVLLFGGLIWLRRRR